MDPAKWDYMRWDKFRWDVFRPDFDDLVENVENASTPTFADIVSRVEHAKSPTFTDLIAKIEDSKAPSFADLVTQIENANPPSNPFDVLVERIESVSPKSLGGIDPCIAGGFRTGRIRCGCYLPLFDELLEIIEKSG